jgi:nitrite reductase (NO-forming)
MSKSLTQADIQDRGIPSWPKDAVRIAFGVIWLIDAVLKWLPGFRTTYMGNVMGTAQGQPAATRWWFDLWIRLEHPHATHFAYIVAVVETLIALSLIFGFARKLSYSAAILFSLLIWATAEGFGGPYTAGSADIGTAIIYAVVFAGLLAMSYYTGPSRLSADYYLEQKFTWWWRVAEMRRPLPEHLEVRVVQNNLAPGSPDATDPLADRPLSEAAPSVPSDVSRPTPVS